MNRQFTNLLKRNKDAFQLDGEPLGRTDLVNMTSILKGSQCQKSLVSGMKQRKFGARDKDDRAISSPWASPVVLAKKRMGLTGSVTTENLTV